MHDFSLGGPVDCGAYCGIMVDGKPVHQGNCEDGVYGCRKCNRAIRNMSPEDRKRWLPDYNSEQECDYCHKKVDISEIHGHSDRDEPGVYQEICTHCKTRYNKAIAEEDKDLPYYYYDED